MRLALALSVVCFAQVAYADAISEQATLLAPIRIDALTVIPIVATPALPATKLDLITLDEGFARGQIEIRELDSMDANQLTLTNKSDRPLFVLSGEVIIGGKQDRILGANTIVPPKTTQSIPVFCVEHGRSSGDTAVFTSAKALAHGRLRGNASYRDQDQVWDEVAKKNELRDTENATDTYRRVAAQQTNGTLAKQEKALVTALAKNSVADKQRMIGFVVALDGKVVTVDMFASPALFQKLQTKLVKSYVTDAIDVKATKANIAPTAKAVTAFMSESSKAEKEKAYATPAATTSVQKTDTSANSAVEVEGAPVYKNYQSMW